MSMDEERENKGVRERLLKAALACFLADEYHAVTTRKIAADAKVNVSMIRYYFGNKEGLFEEAIREVYAPILDSLDGGVLTDGLGFRTFLKLYYDAMAKNPAFPKLIMKILALNQGPGKRFVQQLLERGRLRGAQKVADMKQSGHIDVGVNPDILRLSFVSLAITPLLLKDIYEQQMGWTMDSAFWEELAAFNGRLLSEGLKPRHFSPTADSDGEGQ